MLERLKGLQATLKIMPSTYTRIQVEALEEDVADAIAEIERAGKWREVASDQAGEILTLSTQLNQYTEAEVVAWQYRLKDLEDRTNLPLGWSPCSEASIGSYADHPEYETRALIVAPKGGQRRMSRRYCKACKRETAWRQGVALENTLTSYGDFPGEGRDEFRDGQTVSRTGPPVGVAVLKCSECGRSVAGDTERGETP